MTHQIPAIRFWLRTIGPACAELPAFRCFLPNPNQPEFRNCRGIPPLRDGPNRRPSGRNDKLRLADDVEEWTCGEIRFSLDNRIVFDFIAKATGLRRGPALWRRWHRGASDAECRRGHSNCRLARSSPDTRRKIACEGIVHIARWQGRKNRFAQGTADSAGKRSRAMAGRRDYKPSRRELEWRCATGCLVQW